MAADKVVVTSRKAGEAEGWRWTSDGGGEFTIAEAEQDARGTTVAVHLKKKGDRVRRIGAAARGREHLRRPHRATDRVQGWRQGGDAEHGFGAVDAAPQGDYAGAIHRVLPPRRPRLRRALAGPARPRRGQDRIHDAAVRSRRPPLRPVQSRAQASGQALRQAGLHHRRLRGPVAAVSALRAGHRRFRGLAAQHQPRNLAAQSGCGADSDRGDQAAVPGAEEEGGQGARRIRRVLGKFRRGPEGRALRGQRPARDAIRTRPLPLHDFR